MVLDEAVYNTTLLIKKALHIRLSDKETLLNRDEVVIVSDCWEAILSHTHAITNAASSSTDLRCRQTPLERRIRKILPKLAVEQ